MRILVGAYLISSTGFEAAPKTPAPGRGMVQRFKKRAKKRRASPVRLGQGPAEYMYPGDQCSGGMGWRCMPWFWMLGMPVCGEKWLW